MDGTESNAVNDDAINNETDSTVGSSGDMINNLSGAELYEKLFADTGSREGIPVKDWRAGWPAIVGGLNGIPTSRQFNTLQYITDLKLLLLFQDLENFKKEVRERLDSLTTQGGEITEIVKPLIKYKIATDQDIDDIMDGVYEDDVDYHSMLDIATNRDIDNIVAGVYEDDVDEAGENLATDEDIDAIIAGTYVEDEDPEEYDATEDEINRIIDNAFQAEETE